MDGPLYTIPLLKVLIWGYILSYSSQNQFFSSRNSGLVCTLHFYIPLFDKQLSTNCNMKTTSFDEDEVSEEEINLINFFLYNDGFEPSLPLFEDNFELQFLGLSTFTHSVTVFIVWIKTAYLHFSKYFPLQLFQTNILPLVNKKNHDLSKNWVLFY